MSSAEVVCCKYLPSITDELSIEANSVDPEQTAPIGAVWSGSTLFAIEASSKFQQMRKADDFCFDWRIKVFKLFFISQEKFAQSPQQQAYIRKK